MSANLNEKWLSCEYFNESISVPAEQLRQNLNLIRWFVNTASERHKEMTFNTSTRLDPEVLRQYEIKPN